MFSSACTKFIGSLYLKNLKLQARKVKAFPECGPHRVAAAWGNNSENRDFTVWNKPHITIGLFNSWKIKLTFPKI